MLTWCPSQLGPWADDSSWASRRTCPGQQGNPVWGCCGKSQGPCHGRPPHRYKNQSWLRLCNSPFTINSTSSLLPKAIYRSNAIPIKLPMAFSTELDQFKKKKICMETQKSLNGQSNLEKEKQSWRNPLPWPQTTLQSYGIKPVWNWHRNRHIFIAQWDRIESQK